MFLVREVSRKATFLSVHISDIFSAAFLFHCLALTVQKETNIVLTKSLWGTQRLFPVKYLFGEANINLNFLVLEDGLKISRWLFHSCTIFVAYLIDSYDSLKFNFSHFTPRLGFFRRKKRNLKFSDSKIWWREKTEKSSLSKYVKLYLKFSGK